MRALVVGGTGPSGVPIVERLLARGYQVAIYHTGAHEHDFAGPVEHIHGDPRELADLQRDLGRRTFDLAISTSGRIRYVVEALKGRVARLVAVSGLPVYAGGLAEIGDPGIPVPIREDDPLVESTAQHAYGYRVVRGEQAVRDAHEAGHFEAAILRYTMVYGPYAAIPFEWYLVRRALDRRPYLVLEADGLMVPQRGYGENLAHAALLAAESPRAAGRVYNVGDEQSLTLRAIAELVASTLGHRWELVSVPLAASPCGNPFALRQNTVFDLSRIRSELGYRDVVPVVEATRRAVRWLAEHPPAPGGSEERSLGPHAFDYAREDRAIERFRAFGPGSG